jgi:hypothetical protein
MAGRRRSAAERWSAARGAGTPPPAEHAHRRCCVRLAHLRAQLLPPARETTAVAVTAGVGGRQTVNDGAPDFSIESKPLHDWTAMCRDEQLIADIRACAAILMMSFHTNPDRTLPPLEMEPGVPQYAWDLDSPAPVVSWETVEMRGRPLVQPAPPPLGWGAHKCSAAEVFGVPAASPHAGVFS